jgi:ABC-2 type transport system ATP-binding protein
MQDEEIVIKVENVYKDFTLPNEKVSTIKGLFTRLLKKRNKKSDKTQHALRDINFEIKKGEFFGIVGRNGSGKSTLLKILAGIYQPTSGKTYTKGKLVPFIELGVGFNNELTGKENVYLNGAMLGFSQKQVSEMYEEIVKFAELESFMNQKLKNYSSGMQVRLAFSMAVRAKADILLIDEVLAVGDADFQRKCYDYFKSLKNTGTTVIFVTHDMNAVREYCDRAILIEKSRVIEKGSATEVASSYTRMFIEDVKPDDEEKQNNKRWGDRAISYTDFKVSPKKTTDSDEEVVINLKATVNKDVENPLFGFLIKNASREHILGTNTQIAGEKIGVLKKGEKIEIEWRVPNIFNDGLHYVDPAITYKAGNQVADWWEEAGSFRVLKENSTPYIISPKINLLISSSDS